MMKLTSIYSFLSSLILCNSSRSLERVSITSNNSSFERSSFDFFDGRKYQKIYTILNIYKWQKNVIEQNLLFNNM